MLLLPSAMLCNSFALKSALSMKSSSSMGPAPNSPSRTLVFLFLVGAALAWAFSPSFAQTDPPDAEPVAAAPETDETDEAAAGAPKKEAPVETPAVDDTPIAMPLIKLGVGVAVVLGLIIVFKVNAFIALIAAAMVVSLIAPGDVGGKIGRVASAFGSSAGGIGIVIAMAAVIGKCMLDSGSADRIVRAFLALFGVKRSPIALMGSGFVLAVPVFFDTVFYLLVPLARSLHRQTKVDYLKYILAIAAGGAITHTLVPPTPGPLLMADNLGIDVGLMILVGALVALPAAVAGLVFAGIAQRVMQTEMRQVGNEPDPMPLKDSELPSLFVSLLPVLLPVLMISTSTVLNTLADAEHRALMSVDSVEDWSAFRTQLTEQEQASGDNPGKRLLDHKAMNKPLSTEGPTAKDLLLQTAPLTDEEKSQVISAMNVLLADRAFYDQDAFLGIKLSSTAQSLAQQDTERMKKPVAERRNRLLLESAYPGVIAEHQWVTPKRTAANWSDLFGNANLALLISTIIAMITLAIQRGLSREELAKAVELSLMSGGVIILITAGGGAFGAMLKAAEVGPAIKALFSGQGEEMSSGLAFLLLGFLIATVLKIAQGSSTVAMIVGSSMMAAIIGDSILPFNPVYVATAIGAGSLMGSWMNDSGFWIFAKMGGITEVEALKSWTLMLIVLGLVSLAMTILLTYVLPLV